MDASRDQLDRVDWWNPVVRATTVPAGIWAVRSRVTQSEWTAQVRGVEGRCASEGASITVTCAAANVMTDWDLWKSQQLQ